MTEAGENGRDRGFEERLAALSQQLQGLDDEFSRKANVLLDEIVLTRDQIAESRRDIDQLANRMGELAQSVSDLRQSQQLLTFGMSQMMESMTVLRQTQLAFIEQATADRAVILENQAEIRRIWEYLLRQHPNGQG